MRSGEREPSDKYKSNARKVRRPISRVINSAWSAGSAPLRAQQGADYNITANYQRKLRRIHDDSWLKFERVTAAVSWGASLDRSSRVIMTGVTLLPLSPVNFSLRIFLFRADGARVQDTLDPLVAPHLGLHCELSGHRRSCDMSVDLREPLKKIVRGNMTPFVRRSEVRTFQYSHAMSRVYLSAGRGKLCPWCRQNRPWTKIIREYPMNNVARCFGIWKI